MNKILTVFTVVMSCLAATTVCAQPIDINGEIFELGNHAFPVKAEQLNIPVTEVSIADSYTYLEGADLSGWLHNMTSQTPVKLTFQAPIEDQPGDDIYFGQGRMLEYSPPSGDRHALEYSFDGNTWYYLGHSDFTMSSSYWYNARDSWNWYFQIFRSSIDLENHNITTPITEIYVRGVDTLNLVVVGNMNQGTEIDTYKPLVTLYPESISYIQNNKTKYIGSYFAKIFAHDASSIKRVTLFQKVQGETTWTNVESTNNLINNIGGTFGGYYRVTFDYSSYPAGTVLFFRHVIKDFANQSTVIIKKARVKANKSLVFLN
ncbi:MAG: hypothetical protein PHC51_10105 [bacterium]|nr:hypothetical protein [bacterium]